MERSVSELDQDALVGAPKRGDHQRRDALTPVPTLTSIPSRFVHDVSSLFIEFVNFVSNFILPWIVILLYFLSVVTTIVPCFRVHRESCVRRKRNFVNGEMVLVEYCSHTRVEHVEVSELNYYVVRWCEFMYCFRKKIHFEWNRELPRRRSGRWSMKIRNTWILTPGIRKSGSINWHE